MTPDATIFADVTSADGYLLVLAVILPVIGILLTMAFGGQHATGSIRRRWRRGIVEAMAPNAAKVRIWPTRWMIVPLRSDPATIPAQKHVDEKFRPVRRREELIGNEP